MARLEDDLPIVHVAAAEVCVTRKPMFLQTVLGSCVAATFWCPRLRIGAMCHGALPCCPEKLVRETDLKSQLRYVDYAIRYLARRLGSMGAHRSELEIKLFGGADVLPISSRRPGDSVGRQNALIATRTVEEEGLRLIVSDLGGKSGRVIYFRTDVGDVLLRRLASAELAAADRVEAGLELEGTPTEII